jgi:hypothetical protein
MFYETADRNPWRSEEAARSLLERKLASAFATGGAGFIEWLWNTNPYMNSDNEAAIGLHRVDGTAKPELEPLLRYAKFFHENARLMVDKIDEDIVMVIPYANKYSPRDTATEATKRCVRIIMTRFHLPMSSCSERSGPGTAKLILYPSPGIIPEDAWQRALGSVETGQCLFISGPLETDDYSMMVPRLKLFNLSATVAPIAQEEVLEIDHQRYYLDYRGDKMQKVQKALVSGDAVARLHVIPHGKGTIYWSPLPVEMSDTSGVLETIYSLVIQKTGVERIIAVENDTPLVAVVPVIFKNSILCLLISETDQTSEVRIKHLETSKSINVTLLGGRTALAWIERSTGNVIAKLA